MLVAFSKMPEERIAVYYPGKYSHFFSATYHEADYSTRRVGNIGKLFMIEQA